MGIFNKKNERPPGPKETPNRKKEAQTDSQGRKKKGGRERVRARKTGNKMNNKNKLQFQGLNVPS